MSERPACLPVAAILLAAGSASRMGKQKQLLPYHGKTLVEHAIAQAQLARFEPVVVVVGADAQPIRDKLASLPIAIVENERWLSGMGSSIAAGMGWLREHGIESAAVAILLADQPLVTAAHLAAMRTLFIQSGSAIVAARYRQTLGVPALFKRALFPALGSLAGAEGARSLLRDPTHAVAAFDLPEAAVDIDTPADFAALSTTAAEASALPEPPVRRQT